MPTKNFWLLVLLVSLPAAPVAGVASNAMVKSFASEDEKEIVSIAQSLLSSSNAVGFVAIGTAEGTRTRNGGKTSLYNYHEDPGNRARNIGTCSWQTGGASTPEEADELCRTKRLLGETLPMLIRESKKHKVPLDAETLVIGFDAAVQAPLAAQDFIKHLASDKCKRESDPHHCARVNSFFNPDTGKWEVTNIFKPLGALEHDQARRIGEIRETLAADSSSKRTTAVR